MIGKITDILCSEGPYKLQYSDGSESDYIYITRLAPATYAEFAKQKLETPLARNENLKRLAREHASPREAIELFPKDTHFSTLASRSFSRPKGVGLYNHANSPRGSGYENSGGHR